jgi:hypothetical protein
MCLLMDAWKKFNKKNVHTVETLLYYWHFSPIAASATESDGTGRRGSKVAATPVLCVQRVPRAGVQVSVGGSLLPKTGASLAAESHQSLPDWGLGFRLCRKSFLFWLTASVKYMCLVQKIRLLTKIGAPVAAESHQSLPEWVLGFRLCRKSFLFRLAASVKYSRTCPSSHLPLTAICIFLASLFLTLCNTFPI